MRDGKIHLPSDITFQIFTILCLNRGNQIIILDGIGKKYLTEISNYKSNNAVAIIQSELTTPLKQRLN